MPVVDIDTLTLSNGLRVELCHASRFRRCAAVVRVAAGSHDAPGRWPGLAHFLEHLFFLGTERFPAGEHLMAYVQRHGGQVNASTRERTTDFFFELPPGAFAGGLERLCDMLVAPRLALDDQLREREVLHAEFIAWGRDADAQRQFAALSALSPRHPLRGFHAGNRYSLAVPNPAFQQALRAFYQRFYQAGQITLSLTGPQPLNELAQLAERYGAPFAQGSAVPQASPAALRPAPCTIDTPTPSIRLLLCEGLPVDPREAARFVCHGLNAEHPGGLADVLRTRGLAETLHASVLYAFAGQVVIEVKVKGGSDARAIDQLLVGWLAFFRQRWQALLDEYLTIETRRLATASALDIARHRVEAAASLQPDDITSLLSGLTLATPWPTGAPLEGDWKLPAANPLLAALPALPGSDQVPKGLSVSHILPPDGEATLHLRWRPLSGQPGANRHLQARLQPLIEQARQAGVAVTCSATGTHRLLRLNGLAEVLLHVLQRALPLITASEPASLTKAAPPALIPIRHLLEALPDQLASVASAPQSKLEPETHWHALAQGFDDAHQRMLNNLLRHAMGKGSATFQTASNLPAGRHWRALSQPSAEHALLVYCPPPQAHGTEKRLRHEAAWRLLAHLLQAPFYQRLRVELQLGYAVFSAYRHIEGYGGLLFGVQSPGSTVGEILEHLRRFLVDLPALIDGSDMPAQRHALAEQLRLEGMDTAQAAELLWNGHLAGHQEDYAQRLRQAVFEMEATTLRDAARQLLGAEGGWLCLANRPEPDGWQDLAVDSYAT